MIVQFISCHWQIGNHLVALINELASCRAPSLWQLGPVNGDFHHNLWFLSIILHVVWSYDLYILYISNKPLSGHVLVRVNH